MRLRIAIWAGVGIFVAVCWALYIAAIFPTPLATQRPVLDLVYLTCPIALVHNHPVSFYGVLFANAGTYALVGGIVEIVRQQWHVRKLRTISS